MNEVKSHLYTLEKDVNQIKLLSNIQKELKIQNNLLRYLIKIIIIHNEKR